MYQISQLEINMFFHFCGIFWSIFRNFGKLWLCFFINNGSKFSFCCHLEWPKSGDTILNSSYESSASVFSVIFHNLPSFFVKGIFKRSYN